MSDWRTLPAGRELDCVVAERLGWKNIEQYRDGEWLGGDPADDYGLQPVPRYSTDANAVDTLPLPENYRWVLEKLGDEYFTAIEREGEYEDWGQSYARVAEQFSKQSFTHARSLAWLEYHEADHA